jgi:Fe2+ transport system protein FeoA
MDLRTIAIGEKVTVVAVEVERLVSLGIKPGATIVVLRRKKGCMHIRVGMTEWAVRDSTSDSIKILGIEDGCL